MAKDWSVLLGDWFFRHRGIFPVFILLPGIGLHYYKTALTGSQDTSGSYDYILYAVAWFGEFIRVWVVGHSPKGTSGRNTSGQVADQLILDGPYSMTRNPLYFANALVWITIALVVKSPIFTLISASFTFVFYYFIIKAEEHFLSEKYKQDYIFYFNSTSRFWPMLSNYKPSHLSFNWKKVLRKEKNGIAAITSVFFVFNLEGALPQNHLNIPDFLSDNIFWTLQAVVGFSTYLVIKCLMSFTNWLDNTRP